MASNRSKCATKSILATTIKVTIIMLVKNTIHALRPPGRGSLIKSIRGAHAHLKALGRNMAPTKAPMNSSGTPC